MKACQEDKEMKERGKATKIDEISKVCDDHDVTLRAGIDEPALRVQKFHVTTQASHE